MVTKASSFEETIQALEKIVEQLEHGDLSLDAALKQFEKGVQLSSACQKILQSAEQKVTILSKNEVSVDESSDVSESD